MDDEIQLLFQRSQELIEISRKAHKEADSIRRRLQVIDGENSAAIRRSEQRIKESIEIRDSLIIVRR